MTRIPVLLLAGAASLTVGCATEAFCFMNCEDDVNPYGASDGGPNGQDSSTAIDVGNNRPDGTVIDLDGPIVTGECVAKEEVCNGIDDDCDGVIDDGIQFDLVGSCGNCQTNCTAQEHVFKPSCVPPAVLDGSLAGTCQYESCEVDFYDLDSNVAGCEYYCPWNPDGTNQVDLGGAQGCNKDDDCDGRVDEDVALCSDVENCGQCGRKCVASHGTPACVSTAATGETCTTVNTHCAVAQCEAGWVDADRSPDNGCEYQCQPTNPPTEVCDGVDNDCDQLIDNTDPDLELVLGTACFGGTTGVCQAADHQGILKCVGGQPTCCDPDSNLAAGTNPALPATGVRNGVCSATTGIQVVRPDEVLEACNGLDDDCDGLVDNSPRDIGAACGASSVGNCVKGLLQCLAGVPTCIGALGPQLEVCNGQDDDCDGVIDGTVPAGAAQACTIASGCPAGLSCAPSTQQAGMICVLPTTDSGSACDVPLSPPTGYTSACQAGALSCQGGILRCAGSITANAAAADACGQDTNCDGQVDNQPNLQTDVHHCGTCSNDCVAGSAFATWTCVNGQCQSTCASNRISCTKPCDTECVRTAETDSVCNGLDDDCDCSIDEDILPAQMPTPAQACGVSSSANDPGCVPYDAQNNPTGVRVECKSGAWVCAFSAGYCIGAAPDYCLNQLDQCDDKDNNCNGIADEGFVRPIATQGVKGDACSTDALGACRATGIYACNAAGDATVCNAQAKSASNETCNGIDDDCDGLIDEGYAEEGNDPSFVKPEVVALTPTGPWIFAYEASRPNATATDSGSGNGYFAFGPVGQPRDKTPACSVSGRMPWTNVTPAEVEQTCAAAGGRICRLSEWQQGCGGNTGTTVNNCLFGYSPAGTGSAACQQSANYTSGPFCNLAGFGAQDTLLPTRSASLNSCYADWITLGSTLGLYDVTGNAREITRCQPDRAVCGNGDAAQCARDCCSSTSTEVPGPAGATRLCGTLTVPAATECGHSVIENGNPVLPDCPTGYACNDVTPDNGSTGPVNDTCSNLRRTSGQPCNAPAQCCNDDVACSDNGVCDTTATPAVCRNTAGTRCLARGVAGCDSTTNPCCGGELCVQVDATTSVCGGPVALNSAVFPLMGGAYETVAETGAQCGFSFFKVEPAFKLFDSGFRCCFDTDPTQ